MLEIQIVAGVYDPQGEALYPGVLIYLFVVRQRFVETVFSVMRQSSAIMRPKRTFICRISTSSKQEMIGFQTFGAIF